MGKYLWLACVILALVSFFAVRGIIAQEKEIGVLEAKNEELAQQIKLKEEAMKNAEMEANRTIKELREKGRKNKENFDWYNTPVPDDVRDVLLKQYKKRSDK